MAKFCSQCGKEVDENAVICVSCGCSLAPVTPVNTKKSNAPLILGIVGIVFAFLFALVGHITSIIGIVLGVKEYKKNGNKTGLIVSIVGEALCLISSISGAIMAVVAMMQLSMM